MFEVDWTRVPVPYMTDGLKLYVERGILPGDFLIALLSNDLLEAYRRADDNNTAAMRDWASFLHNQLPRGCHGSREAVQAWCKAGGLGVGASSKGSTKTEEATEEMYKILEIQASKDKAETFVNNILKPQKPD
jgi:hypothetical protein